MPWEQPKEIAKRQKTKKTKQKKPVSCPKGSSEESYSVQGTGLDQLMDVESRLVVAKGEGEGAGGTGSLGFMDANG